jgi:uncharacterized membrane protein YdjX (TVP38/TMEM64 family)
MKYWFAIWISVTCGMIALALLFEESVSTAVMSRAEDWTTVPGPAAMLGIFLLLSLDFLLPIPSSLVMILSGAAFGSMAGGLLSFLGSLAGNLLGFELTRRYGESFSRRAAGEQDFERVRRFFEHYGLLAIVLSRPVPVLMETLSLTAGLARMDRSKFLAGSVLGTLPICFVYAYAGSVSLEGNLWPAPVAAVGIPALCWLVVRRLNRKRPIRRLGR